MGIPWRQLFVNVTKTSSIGFVLFALVHLPVPKLIVFYNGLDKKEDTVLKLSDAFAPENKEESCGKQGGGEKYVYNGI